MNAFLRKQAVLEDINWVVLNRFFTPIMQLAMMTETSEWVERRKSVNFHSVFRSSENNRLKAKMTDQPFGYWNKPLVPSLDVSGESILGESAQVTDLLGSLDDNIELGVFQQVHSTLARSSKPTLVVSRNSTEQPYENCRALWK